MCFAMVAQSSDRRSAAHATLHAAWVCDDHELDDMAHQFRRAAIDSLVSAEPLEDMSKAIVEDAVIVDMLRRVSEFSLAADRCDQLLNKTSDANVRAVLIFQRDLIAARDCTCHRVADAVA
jgi:hypothetical protein